MEPVRDYTAERDSRVMPFIKNFLLSLGTFPFVFADDAKDEAQTTAEAQSHIDFYQNEFMPKAMAQNLQLSDLNYTFQQVKNAVEMLRARAHVPGYDARDRTIPAAKEILAALSHEESLMLAPVLNAKGEESDQDGLARAALYDKIYHDKVIPILTAYNIGFHEVEDVFAVMTVLITITAENTNRTLDQARHYADSKLWGVEDVDHLTVNQLHEKCIEDSKE